MPHCLSCRRYFSIGGHKYSKCKECRYKPNIIIEKHHEPAQQTTEVTYTTNYSQPTYAPPVCYTQTNYQPASQFTTVSQTTPYVNPPVYVQPPAHGQPPPGYNGQPAPGYQPPAYGQPPINGQPPYGQPGNSYTQTTYYNQPPVQTGQTVTTHGTYPTAPIPPVVNTTQTTTQYNYTCSNGPPPYY